MRWHPAFVAVALIMNAGVSAAQGIGPDAAVGSVEERLQSAILFDSAGAFVPGAGFTAHVRLSWEGTAGFKSRSVYQQAPADALAEHLFTDARRSGFYNFKVTSSSLVNGASSSSLPAAVEYDVREAMDFGSGGRSWQFYLPVPGVFRTIRAQTTAVSIPDNTPLDVRRVLEATPPPGVLPVCEVGRWTVRARYELATGMYATAPDASHIETDFATYDSHYAVEGRSVVAERTLVCKQLTIDPAREPELREFRAAIERDRHHEFHMVSFEPGKESEVDRLNAEGCAAFDRHDFNAAVAVLQRAVESDSKHVASWYNLCSSHLSRGDAPSAISACERAMQLDDSYPNIRVLLASTYWAGQRFADTERELQEQVKRYPWSAWSLQWLAEYYLWRHQLDDAALWLERSLDAGPRNERAVLQLGQTYLDLGRADDAVKTYKTGLQLSREWTAFNGAAFQLADRSVALPTAAGFADASLDALVKQLDPDADGGPMPLDRFTGAVSMVWDTAGWVAYKRGQTDLALTWLSAAWNLSEEGEVGEHLGDVLASAKRVEDAAHAYAGALARQPNRASIRTKLTALRPGDVSAQLTAAESELNKTRAIPVQSRSKTQWSGDVAIIHGRDGHVLEARALSADPLPAPVADDLRSITLIFAAPPDARDYRIERRGTLTCAGTNNVCTLQLRRPSEAIPATQ